MDYRCKDKKTFTLLCYRVLVDFDCSIHYRQFHTCISSVHCQQVNTIITYTIPYFIYFQSFIVYLCVFHNKHTNTSIHQNSYIMFTMNRHKSRGEYWNRWLPFPSERLVVYDSRNSMSTRVDIPLDAYPPLRSAKHNGQELDMPALLGGSSDVKNINRCIHTHMSFV